jgi:FkbM family methyltransferase
MSLSYSLKKSYQKLIFNLSATENPLYLGFYKYFYSPPKNSLAAFLDKFSRKRSGIKFIQIGANDGFIHDPLHKFIKRDNWSGVMLEPQPDVYEQYLLKLYQSRDEVITINAALDKKDGKATLYKIGPSKDRWATGLASFDRKVLHRNLLKEKTKRKARKQGLEIPENPEKWIEAVKIDTISTDTLLKKGKTRNPDILAIDTEGFDFEILKMFDLSKVNPDVIIYEEENFDQVTKESCKNYLTEHEYVYHQVGRDAYAVKKGLKI